MQSWSQLSNTLHVEQPLTYDQAIRKSSPKPAHTRPRSHSRAFNFANRILRSCRRPRTAPPKQDKNRSSSRSEQSKTESSVFTPTLKRVTIRTPPPWRSTTPAAVVRPALASAEARMPIGHFVSNGPPSPVLAPKIVAYPGLQQAPKTEHPVANYVRSLSERCHSCGLATWQCANATNLHGTDFTRIPNLDVHVEMRDHARLHRYWKRGATADRTNWEFVTLFLIHRNGSSQNPVEVRVGFPAHAVPVIYMCEGKRAEIAYHFRDHVDVIRVGTMATTYMVNAAGNFIIGALLVRS